MLSVNEWQRQLVQQCFVVRFERCKAFDYLLTFVRSFLLFIEF